ncbi:MAG: hypothetical protein IPM06_17180 [Rhizobiales bacterium]|nr:hypothetical protein [Hyphomicrobiales bacterium]
MFFDIDKPLPQVRPAIFRRAVTVILFLALALPLGMAWGLIQGLTTGMHEAWMFLRDCWNGDGA